MTAQPQHGHSVSLPVCGHCHPPVPSVVPVPVLALTPPHPPCKQLLAVEVGGSGSCSWPCPSSSSSPSPLLPVSTPRAVACSGGSGCCCAGRCGVIWLQGGQRRRGGVTGGCRVHTRRVSPCRGLPAPFDCRLPFVCHPSSFVVVLHPSLFVLCPSLFVLCPSLFVLCPLSSVLCCLLFVVCCLLSIF
jgi:hypothetical protein